MSRINAHKKRAQPDGSVRLSAKYKMPFEHLAACQLFYFIGRLTR